MKVIEARNVHDAFIKGIHELRRFGIARNSRNGPVIVMPTPVTTAYQFPKERVIFWPERDANPFFHLYESLWMLMSKDDVEPLIRYAKNIENYADQGIMHGAYGRRWRKMFGMDQLRIIVQRLKNDPDDRRCVLQMWDAKLDLDRSFRDLPCNVTATFQRNEEGKLDLTVFCRSNDIIWGAYGANAVHFSVLQEYMARCIGCEVGYYYQVSVNWHAYKNVLDKLIIDENYPNPYDEMTVYSTFFPVGNQEYLDMIIRDISGIADEGFRRDLGTGASHWEMIVYHVLQAHFVYKTSKSIDEALASLEPVIPLRADWVVAAVEWLERRRGRGVGAKTKP